MGVEQISRYPVLRSLGRGGMGQVFLARDPELDRDVALKVLSAEADGDQGVDRLRDEARAVAALEHPNIVTVYEIGADGDRAFIAMEYIDGDSLRARMDAGVDSADLLAIGAQVARALEAAHDAGVLHRDIKPDNVMLHRKGTVKVVDFGIAHRLDAQPAARPPTPSGEAITGRVDPIAPTLVGTLGATLPDTGRDATAQTIFGTPAYMAPEVVCGEPALPASDVYALGVTLYEGLASRLPYRGRTILETLTLVADPDARFAPLADSCPDLDPEAVALIESMLAHDPGQRPSAAEVADHLEALSAPATEPIEVIRTTAAPPPSRLPWLVAIGGVTLAAAAIVGLLWSRSGPEAAPEGRPTAVGATVTLAIAGVDADYSGFGHGAFKPASVARVLAEIFASTDSIEPLVIDGEEPLEAAREAKASLLLVAHLRVDDDRARGGFELVDVASGEVRHRGDIDSGDLAGAITALTRSVVETLEITPPGDWRETSARISFELGLAAYRRLSWNSARLMFEQAVHFDPDYPAGWFYLAWTRGWSGAPAALTEEAGRRAIETARTDLERALARAVALYNFRRYREAAEVLEPLVDDTTRDRDLLYTYAEALFHDGHVTRALELFDRCLEVAPRFQPAAVHPLQVAAARQDSTNYRRYRTLSGKPYEGMVAYFGGDNGEAAAKGFGRWRLAAVLGDYAATDQKRAGGRSAKDLAYVMSRAAQRGERAAARRRFAELWPEIAEAAKEPRGAFDLQILVRTLLMGGYPAEMQVVQRWWEDNKTPVNLMAQQELAVFAPLLIDAQLPPTDQLTTRLGRTAAGIAALEAGEADRAAELLGELAAVPTGRGGDFLVWFAWARALEAAGRDEALEAACDRWRRPGYLDESMLALWAYCDQALR